MRFFKKLLHKNKKAFSLVEVMCAIVLLAIVATPIIQVAFSSMSTNIKSRKYLAAADITSDTMEFISSLTFQEHKFKDTDGSTKYVPGLQAYYWGKDESYAISNLVLNGSGQLYPGYPTSPSPQYCKCVYSSLTGNPAGSGWKLGEHYRTLTIKDVMMDGMKFDVVIDMNNTSASPGADMYYTYDVEVKVMEAGKSKVLSSAKTSIANSY